MTAPTNQAGFWQNLRQVPAEYLGKAKNYLIANPWHVGGGTAVLGGLAGAVMAPPTGYSPQEIIAASQTDKDLLIDQMARQGIYSNEELLAASKLSSDELVQFLAQQQRTPGNAGLGFLVGAGVGAGLGTAGLGMLKARRAATQQGGF